MCLHVLYIKRRYMENSALKFFQIHTANQKNLELHQPYNGYKALI